MSVERLIKVQVDFWLVAVFCFKTMNQKFSSLQVSQFGLSNQNPDGLPQ